MAEILHITLYFLHHCGSLQNQESRAPIPWLESLGAKCAVIADHEEANCLSEIFYIQVKELQ